MIDARSEPPMTPEEVDSIIVRLKTAGILQQEAADRLGVTRQALLKWARKGGPNRGKWPQIPFAYAFILRQLEKETLAGK